MVSVLQKSFFFALSVICCISRGVLTLKISLDVPDKVVQGQDAILRCGYDLEGEDLHVLKWYKDNVEFYRHVPESRPHDSFYPVQGVKVDRKRSAHGSVYIKDVTSSAAGVYRCEVSTDAPSFRTQTDEKLLSVEDDKTTSKQIDTGDGFDRSLESKSEQPAGSTYLCQEHLLSLLGGQQLQKPKLEERTCTFFASFGEYIYDMTENEKLELHKVILQKISDIKANRN